MIHPCKCNGSMRYVHEECLKLWILSSNQEMKDVCCDICKHLFDMKIIVKRVCSGKNFKDECFKLFIFPLVISLISTVFAVVLMFLAEGIKKGDLKTEEKVYFSLVIFACMLIIITLIFIFVKSIMNACCEVKMTEWCIESMKNEIFDETFEVTHQSELSHHDSASQNERGEFNRNNYNFGTHLNNESITAIPYRTHNYGRSLVVPVISNETFNRIREFATERK
ncbi:hypothetical protein SteCoe_35517 [Stentor coeruleus]|uniref:RING-CH-type domain-containing protein n=1 Tax=Stentor coeruleus TaxID=5963 RepID=A0A1R2AS82_9CILI|nr:hypothetical protein SteCoe_35517 [Stentor coeruleus]